MGATFSVLSDQHRAFIEQQLMFFVATATAESRISCSPKGMDSLRVVAPDRILWVNLTGSGNETAAHLLADGRMTIMWCSLGPKPLIMRVYGRARAVHQHDSDWDALQALLPALPGARQLIEMTVDLVQTSCGYGVPIAEQLSERPRLGEWCEEKGPEGIRDYQDRQNRYSLDGLPTGVLPD